MAKTIIPVTDLNQKPIPVIPRNFGQNLLRASQLLFNEEVKILKKQDNWLYVAALEQYVFISKKWKPYEGWVKIEAIGEGRISPKFVVCQTEGIYPYGTYLETPLPETRQLSKHLNRQQLIEEAYLFLDTPYLWGGRSSYLSNPVASVDCSGLINLLYRAQGLMIPRNAHDQFLFGKQIHDLQPGDPLYFARDKRISHVILKLEEDLFIEAPSSGKAIRLLRLGKEIEEKKGEWRIFDSPHVYKGYPISLERSDQCLFK
ncbi:MAG: NlpC/P60 family protein [Chlamydiales bacterium]